MGNIMKFPKRKIHASQYHVVNTPQKPNLNKSMFFSSDLWPFSYFKKAWLPRQRGKKNLNVF
jgi:hypothetical protein